MSKTVLYERDGYRIEAVSELSGNVIISVHFRRGNIKPSQELWSSETSTMMIWASTATKVRKAHGVIAKRVAKVNLGQSRIREAQDEINRISTSAPSTSTLPKSYMPPPDPE